MSIADTGRFWEILVIPVLQIPEDSGKYWLYQYCRYWKIRYEVAECTCILFFCPLCASVMRGRTVYRETGRKETRGRRKEKRGEKKEGRKQPIFNLKINSYTQSGMLIRHFCCT